jgi:hypothetical protein
MECDCSPDDVLTQLSVMNVLTLGPDSFMRDEDADAVRRVLSKQHPSTADRQTTAADAQLRELRAKLGTPPPTRSRHTPAGTTPFEAELRRVTAKSRPSQKKSKGKHWYPDNEPLNPLDQAIADRVVPWGERSQRRTPGMIFFDELQEINRIHKQWVQACVEAGHLMLEDEIIAWLKEFPHRALDPHEVIAVAGEDVTPTDAALHLWYGRENPLRPTVFDRICWKDITVDEAKTEIERHKHAG